MLKQSILMAVGVTIFVIGVILFPMPVPLGLPVMIIGLSIMLKASNQVKRVIIRLVNKNQHSILLWRRTRDLHKKIRTRPLSENSDRSD
jgi:hypothetical protein